MKYKLRYNCVSFQDIVVEAKNKEEAKVEAKCIVQCPQNEMEFAEFLEVEESEEVEN